MSYFNHQATEPNKLSGTWCLWEFHSSLFVCLFAPKIRFLK